MEGLKDGQMGQGREEGRETQAELWSLFPTMLRSSDPD